MDNTDLCSNITVLPQYEGTCWFNAIFMICFYSQGVRKLLIKHSNEWNKNESLFKYFKTIIKYSHTKSTKTFDLFIKVKPEIVLLKIMENYDNILKYYFKFKNKNKPISDIKWGHNVRYICDFLKLLKVPYVSINFMSSTNRFIFNLPELTSLWDYLEKKEKAYTYTDIYLKDYIDELKKTIENTPEVIIINEGVNKYDSLKYHQDFSRFFLNEFNFKLKYTDYDSIKNLNNIITFNGTKYKLDSCICVNYNKTKELNYHAIAGITCNDNKYVYNGWNSSTTDGGLKNTLNVKDSPCSLMKFDWDIHKNSEFCLNLEKCKLDPNIISDEELCFNFANNISGRLLVYVKINEEDNESEVKDFESISDLSEKEDLIAKLYKIDILDFTDIINLIAKFNFHFHDLIKENLVILKDITLHIIDSFRNIDYKNDEKVKQIITKYNPKIVFNEFINIRSLYQIYIENFFYKEKPDIIVKDIKLLLSEIKQYNFKLPEFYSFLELNKILFDLKKIEGDSHYFQFFLGFYGISYYEFKDKMHYLLNYLEKISIYYPNKFKSSDKILLKNLAKKLLNDVYLIKNKIQSKSEVKEEPKVIPKPKEEPKVIPKPKEEPKVIPKPKKEPKAIPKSKEEPKSKKEPKAIPKSKQMTKPEIITNIKKLDPAIKGLTTKKKEELLVIYSKLKAK
jgi:hypothetical protein